jgi:acetyl esterase
MRLPVLIPLALLAAGPESYLRTWPPSQAPAIEPRLKAALDAAPPRRPYGEMKIAEVRTLVNRRLNSIPKRGDQVARVENRTFPRPAGALPVRIYTPPGKGPFPVLIYLHGGGWVLGNLDTHDDYCRSLASRASAVVVSVDYRLAPEHPFPAPLNDSYEALKWAAATAASFGGDASRLAVAGDSAGGNLAAATALMARDKGGPKLAIQVLIYPALNYGFETASAHQNASGFGLSRDDMIFYWNRYLARPGDAGNPYASPLRAKDLRGLPRALVITAQFDPLRDDGLAYAARLARDGVPVRCTNYLDMNHGFALSGAIYESARKAMDEVAAELKSAWAR